MTLKLIKTLISQDDFGKLIDIEKDIQKLTDNIPVELLSTDNREALNLIEKYKNNKL